MRWQLGWILLLCLLAGVCRASHRCSAEASDLECFAADAEGESDWGEAPVRRPRYTVTVLEENTPRNVTRPRAASAAASLSRPLSAASLARQPATASLSRPPAPSARGLRAGGAPVRGGRSGARGATSGGGGESSGEGGTGKAGKEKKLETVPQTLAWCWAHTISALKNFTAGGKVSSPQSVVDKTPTANVPILRLVRDYVGMLPTGVKKALSREGLDSQEAKGGLSALKQDQIGALLVKNPGGGPLSLHWIAVRRVNGGIEIANSNYPSKGKKFEGVMSEKEIQEKMGTPVRLLLVKKRNT